MSTKGINRLTVKLSTHLQSIIGLDKPKIQSKKVNILFPISFNICFGCLKESSH